MNTAAAQVVNLIFTIQSRYSEWPARPRTLIISCFPSTSGFLERVLPYNDLREWISALDRAGELKRIKAEVDPILEIAEITDRVSKWPARGKHGAGGPALLFENVKGHPGQRCSSTSSALSAA